jgi:molecular chaperone GrpE
LTSQKHPKPEEDVPAGSQAAPAAAEAGPFAVADPAALDPLQKLLAEKKELMDTLVRRQADFENYRKRIEKERHQDRHRGAEHLAESLLPVLDAFDRALASQDDPSTAEFRKGFELIRRQLWDALVKQGLERVESAGKEFNPHLHHAIERVETAEYPDGVVIEELQPGYLFHGRVLRPAMVRVATQPAHAGKREN